MKLLLVVFIGCLSVVSISGAAIAQESKALEPQAQSDAILLEPVAIERSYPGTKTSTYNSSQLKEVANSIQSTPGGQQSGIPGNIVPKDLIRTPPKRDSDTNPIGDFQVPGPVPSYGINLNQL